MNTATFTSILFSTLFLFSACNDKTEQNQHNNSIATDGIGYAITNDAASNVYNTIVSTLKANPNIGIVAEVNHTANAQNAGLTLDYTRTIYFGNPALGTPVMQENIKAGLDLPQRITVYTNEHGDTVVAYNSIEYLINRHSIGNVSTTDMIANALANIANSSSGKEVIINPANALQTDGIITVLSKNDFDTTYNKILGLLNGLEPVSVIAELDHQANAQSVNMDLNPAKLIIFGNPSLGTPLMVESKTTALDLPQKMLVYQNSNGDIHIIYNDPFYIAERHDIENNNESLMMISQALQNISASGASKD